MALQATSWVAEIPTHIIFPNALPRRGPCAPLHFLLVEEFHNFFALHPVMLFFAALRFAGWQ